MAVPSIYLTPGAVLATAEAWFGRGLAIREERRRTKERTLKQLRLLSQQQAA